MDRPERRFDISVPFSSFRAMTQRQRILFYDYTPQPERMTGITVYGWKILEALLDSGRYDYVLATNRPLDRVPEAIRARMEVISRPAPLNEARALVHNMRAVPRLMRQTRCVASFHPHPTAMLLGGRRSVVVVHDLYRVTNATLFRRRARLQWAAVAFGLRRAGRLIAVSRATRDAMVQAYPSVRGRTHVVHEASPITVDAVADRPAPDMASRYALMVANITPNKNVRLLVAALTQLAEEGVRPRVILVGVDEFGAMPELMAQAGPIDLEFRGKVSDDALRQLYAGAHAYINTSLAEGFCLPILEAQSFGIAVVCSDLPVLREVAGDGALFIDPHDADTLAEAIRTIFHDDATAAAIRARGVANVAQFSWAKAASETEAVLAEVIG